MKKFSREEIRQRFDSKLQEEKPILICQVGIGMTAKMMEKYGIDMMLATTDAIFRMRGLDESVSLKPYGSSNDMVYELLRRIHLVTEHTPVIAGLASGDPRLVFEEYIGMLDRIGVSGIINSPSLGPFRPQLRDNLTYYDGPLSMGSECRMLTRCQEMGLFTVADAYYREDIRMYADLGVDMLIVDLRYAVDKDTNPEVYKDAERVPSIRRPFNPAYYRNVDACCVEMQEIYKEVKFISPHTYVTVLGGPFDCFENVKTLFEKTDLDGFVGGSYLDTDIIRRSILSNQKEFAALKLG